MHPAKVPGAHGAEVYYGGLVPSKARQPSEVPRVSPGTCAVQSRSVSLCIVSVSVSREHGAGNIVARVGTLHRTRNKQGSADEWCGNPLAHDPKKEEQSSRGSERKLGRRKSPLVSDLANQNQTSEVQIGNRRPPKWSADCRLQTAD